MTTITASTTVGIDLNPALYTSPLVISAGVIVSNTGYPYAVYRHSGATNFFVIDNNGAISGSAIGVYLAPGGSVTNAATASIIGASIGVKISGGAGTVVNDGYIQGSQYGVDLLAGGSVTNGASADIGSGLFGVYVSGGAGTVVNDGSIEGLFDGVDLRSGGSVTNGTSAYIAGVVVYGGAGTVVNDGSIAHSVILRSGGTLTNAGSIIGNNGTAVAFGGTGNDLLVLDPGFGFSGIVAGGVSSSNTLELASTASIASAGTVTGLGSEFIRFRSIVFDPGAQWSISGIQRGLAGPISGFAVGDAIELTGVTATGSSFVGSILTLDLVGGGSATLNLPGTFTSASDFRVTNVAAGADVTVACFFAGTRIRTTRGEVAVEALRKGDLLPVAMGGETQPVVWLGHRHIDYRRHPKPTEVWPVCFSAGAFGPGRPFRDLWLSPDHAVFINGVLIPVRYLVNGRTIRQEPRDEVTYWHVELAEHNVLYAEGIPAESYLDTGNRSAFVNGGDVMDMYPDFSWRVWEAKACAPLVLTGPWLAAAKRRLLARTTALGHTTTDDPSLTVLADGKALRAVQDGPMWRVRLPKTTRNVRLVSRIWCPAHMQPDTHDLRTLGVAISRLWRDRDEMALDSSSLVSGWRAREQYWRWTDGDASLTVPGAHELVFEVAMTGTYWLDQHRKEVRAA